MTAGWSVFVIALTALNIVGCIWLLWWPARRRPGDPAPTDTSTVAPLQITAEARVIIGSYLGSAVPSRDIPMFAQLWREGRLPVESLISSTVELDDINVAMDNLADGHAVRQIILFKENGHS